MRKAISVFLRDLRRILRNPVALLVVGGIAVVPCLYAWINVLANWDPYENTADISVAVVTEDQPVELHDVGEICTGDMLVEALKENDKVGWHFLDDRDEAVASVRSGEYYAAIIIPSDFTKHLTGILDGKTDKAHLQYFVNEKVNPIAPKVTDTVASTIQNQVDSQFTAKVGQVIAEKLEGISGEIIDKSESAVDQGISVLEGVQLTLVNVDTQLGDLSTSLQEAKKALSDAADTAEGLEGIGSRVSENLADVLDNFGTTRTNASNLVADINTALGNGSSIISSVSARTNYDVSSIAGDMSTAGSQVNAAIRALEGDLTDSEALTAALTDAHSLLVDINPTDEDALAVRVDLDREITKELDVMVQLSSAQEAKIDELREIAGQIQTTADTVSGMSDSVNSKVQDGTNALADAQTGVVSDALLDIHTALDSFVITAAQLEAAADQVDPLIAQIVALTRQYANVLGGADDALGGTRSSLSDLKDQVGTMLDELDAIRSSEAWKVLRQLVKTDPESVHEFLSAPVNINEVDLFPVANYGSGVAPFFSSLALWVGGIALVAIFKLEVDEDEVGTLRPWQAYFGRWLLFVTIGALQAIACCTGDLVIGIQCAYPWAFYLAAIVASFAFVNVIYGLSVAFKHLGKALAFTLIILQVPGSAGMYPIEMMPPFFQAIGPWLPFTYAINAMREAVAGFYGWNYLHNLGMLLLFVVPSILIGVTMRARLVNINGLFDKRLRETDHLMVSEPIAIDGDHYHLATVVKALHTPDEYREALEERTAAFEKAYPGLVRRGVLALLLLPLLIFALMLLLDAQLPTIACLVIALVCIYSFLIVVEYLHDRVQHKKVLVNMTEDELEGVLVDTLRDEVMPLAPIDALVERKRRRTAAREERAKRSLVGRIKTKAAAKAESQDDPKDSGQAVGQDVQHGVTRDADEAASQDADKGKRQDADKGAEKDADKGNQQDADRGAEKDAAQATAQDTGKGDSHDAQQAETPKGGDAQ